MIVKFNVLQSDIDAGERYNPHECPLSRSIQRGLDIAYACVADVDVTIMKRTDMNLVTIALPDDAQAWRYDFDDGFISKPITFELDIPDSWFEAI